MPANYLDQPAVLCLFGVIQVLGLISAFATRISRRSSRRSASQWVFLVCLGLVATAAVLTVGKPPGCWLTSGTTISLMVVTAVGEFGRPVRESGW
jgi:hypothetical protein